MSTHDDTTPVPTQPAADDATTPVPRTGTGPVEEPTLVLDTFAARPERAAGRAPTDPTEPAATEPSATDAARPAVNRSLRVGTVVWGLVLAIIGAGLIAVAAGARFDLELAAIGLLALAGLALVVGSVVTASRRTR